MSNQSFKKVIYKQAQVKNIKAMYEAEDLKRKMDPVIKGKAESEIMRATFKVLVVSDSPRSQNIMLGVLRQELDFRSTTTVESLDEAKKIVLQYDLVISSYRMCSEDGLDLYKFIQASDTHKKPMFIMAMDYGEYEANNLREAGIVTLPTPFQTGHLSLTVQAMYVKYLDELVRLVNINKHLSIK